MHAVLVYYRGKDAAQLGAYFSSIRVVGSDWVSVGLCNIEPILSVLYELYLLSKNVDNH